MDITRAPAPGPAGASCGHHEGTSARASRSITRAGRVVTVLAGLWGEQVPGRGANSSPNTECVQDCTAEQQRALHRL